MAEEGMGKQTGRNTTTVGTQTDQSFPAQSEMTDDGMGEGGKINTVPVDTYPQSNVSFLSRAELLPGLPDQIALDEIFRRLQWRDFHALSSVSSSWLEAIRNHRVYDARVIAKSTETLVVHIHRWSTSEAIGLYSTTDKRCFELPPIPQLGDRVPPLCQIVSLDGKVYVLGGAGPCDSGSTAVFVWDVAGQRQWEQCASMEHPRQEFGCGILDGKIYVFGGNRGESASRASEVYDPKVNEWSPIAPMPSRRFKHKVAIIGEEFFVYGGEVYKPDFFECHENGPHIDDDDGANGPGPPGGNPHDLVEDNANGTHTGKLSCHIHTAALCLYVYHPAKDEWRVVEQFATRKYQHFFVAKGKFYEMDNDGIHVYDMERNSWIKQLIRQSSEPRYPVTAVVTAFLVVNDELFVRVHMQNTDALAERSRVLPNEIAGLRRREGFDVEKNDTVWQKTNCKCWSVLKFDSMCTILL